MIRHIATAGIAWTMAALAVAADIPAARDGRAQAEAAPSMQADAMKLCERLAGTEREICLQQSRENERMRDAVGATPGGPGSGTVRPVEPQPGGGERK